MMLRAKAYLDMVLLMTDTAEKTELVPDFFKYQKCKYSKTRIWFTKVIYFCPNLNKFLIWGIFFILIE